MVDFDSRLKALNLELPSFSPPLAAYLPGLQSGEHVYISGQLPIREGRVIYSGRLGEELSLEEGQEAARLCVLNGLSIVKNIIGDWNKLVKVVKLTGYVQSASSFKDQPLVINGASLLLDQLLGDKGRHTRSVVGVISLPLNAACMVEMIVQTKN